MNKEFVPYEEALAMKELGFDEKCYGYYTEYKEYFYFDVDDLSSAYTKNMDNLIVNNVDDLECTAPLYQQAFRWFREKYGLWFRPDYYDETRTDFSGSIHKLGRYSAIASIEECKSAEEAELACLRKLIEIVNQNKEDE